MNPPVMLERIAETHSRHGNKYSPLYYARRAYFLS
jgi:hypothetical protein